MFCPDCKSFVSSLDDECKVCGKIFKSQKTKNKSKNSKKSNVKSKKRFNKKSKKNKNKKLSSAIRKNKYLGGKTRHYNDRRNFEFSVLGCYTIW